MMKNFGTFKTADAATEEFVNPRDKKKQRGLSRLCAIFGNENRRRVYAISEVH